MPDSRSESNWGEKKGHAQKWWYDAVNNSWDPADSPRTSFRTIPIKSYRDGWRSKGTQSYPAKAGVLHLTSGRYSECSALFTFLWPSLRNRGRGRVEENASKAFSLGMKVDCKETIWPLWKRSLVEFHTWRTTKMQRLTLVHYLKPCIPSPKILPSH